MTSTQSPGRHRQGTAGQARRHRHQARRRRRVAIAAATVLVAVTAAATARYAVGRSAPPAGPVARQDGRIPLPTKAGSYLGVYPDGVPASYTGVRSFGAATRVQPDVVTYYSGWQEPFQASFAATASRSGAVPLVQMNPTGVSIGAIAAGHYDEYLRAYAAAVHRYGHPVILSFGHEMNGYWYSWASGHTAPATFVAAWQHLVNVFRAAGTSNVTWLWTVNVFQSQAGVSSPRAWWPGASYVTWVGLDGYYYTAAARFSSVFGPAIAGIRAWTRKPILIAETSATPAAGQPAKIADLFAGIRLYGLLGFVWFDNDTNQDWRLTSPAAIASFRRSAQLYRRPTP
ncbi:MAG TPA: glycosyl hydrolase [Streptosporangiaceae bacterium]